MNEKQITITRKESGEVTTGSINEIAQALNINRTTLFRRLKSGKYEDNEIILGYSNVAPEISNVARQRPNVAQEKPNVAFDKFAPIKVGDKIILPSGPCVKCGQNVYHNLIINGVRQFVCFNKCTPATPKPERITTPIPPALKSMI